MESRKKANNSLAFPGRNLSSCPSHIKTKSYQTMVRPVVEPASSVWDPRMDRNIYKLEAVQRRAARFVSGDYRSTCSVFDIISNLGCETVQHRRKNGDDVQDNFWPDRNHSNNSPSSSHSQYKRKYNHTVEQTLIGGPSFHPGYVSRTSNQS